MSYNLMIYCLFHDVETVRAGHMIRQFALMALGNIADSGSGGGGVFLN